MSLVVLLQKILNDLIIHNVTVKLEMVDTVYTKEGTPCGGYFDKDINTLCVAMQNEDAVLVLIHEYCHFKQERENLWVSREEYDMFSKRERWVLGEVEMTPEEVLLATRTIQACEMDCERRVVDMILEWGLTVNINEYIRNSNAYVLSYEWERLNRKLYPGSREVVVLMPNTFLTDFETFPPGYNLLIEKNLNDEATTETNPSTSSSSSETGNNV